MTLAAHKLYPKQFAELPSRFPTTQVDGRPLKLLTQVLLERRATTHFLPDPVPENYLQAILTFGAQAPSGYNLQPWRFIVVRNSEDKARLQKAAMNQGKVGEAPVVIIALGMREEWKNDMDDIFMEGAERGVGKKETIPAQKNGATSFLSGMRMDVWVNRHVMIAVTTMMLVAEAYGLDTAPMEGFDPEAVKREFGIPKEIEVVALLAIGFGKAPDKPYPGRFSVDHIVFADSYGKVW